MEEGSGRKSAGPILHVLVVGFHHKRGCQVRFLYLLSIILSTNFLNDLIIKNKYSI